LDGNVEKLVTIDVQPVPVSGLTLDSEDPYTAPATGGSIYRTATIAPSNAAEKGVNWTSNHPDVTITPSNPVASGTQVTIAVAPGSAAITGAIVTATAVGDGSKKKTITIARTAAPPQPLVINADVRTGFISGAKTSVPTTAKSGRLLIAAADGNSGSTITWNTISNYTASGISYVNTVASKFVGENAGCEPGWRLPSIVELDAVFGYFGTTFGDNRGPSTELAPGFTRLGVSYYATSTFGSVVDEIRGTAWAQSQNSSPSLSYTTASLRVRCVKDIE
jgi:hypothetical protein